MYPDRYNEIAKSLKDKGVNQPCPRCHTSTFTILGESEMPLIQSSSGLMSLVSKLTVPTVVVACENCGFISQYAKLALGIDQGEEQLGALGRAIKK